MTKRKFRGINTLHKMRKIVSNNKTGDVYGITIPRKVGKKYHQRNFVIIKNDSLGKEVSMRTIKDNKNAIFFLIPEKVYKNDFYGSGVLK